MAQTRNRPLGRLPLGDGVSVFVDGDRASWFVSVDVPHSTIPMPDGPESDDDCHCGPADGLAEAWLYTNTDCNLTCPHCVVPERATRPPLEVLLARAGEVLELGATTVFLTGGEPFIRPDLATVVASVAPRANVVVLTNATLIDRARLDEFDALGASEWGHRLSFQVSVDGPREVHDSIRGAGTFDRAVAGIALLSDWGRTPALTTALTGANARHAHEVTALASGLGCRVHHLFLPHRTGSLACAGAAVPDNADLLASVRRCRDVADAAGVVLANDEAIAARLRRPGKRYQWCNGGSSMVAVAADGSVYPCPSLVGETDLSESGEWGLAHALAGERLAQFRCASVERRAACSACVYRYFCGGGCAAHAFRAGGSITSDEPYCGVYRGIVEDHLSREAAKLIASLDQPLTELGSAHPVGREDDPGRTVFGCT